MNQHVKDKWIAALKSGDYKQGAHQLRSKSNQYCCLGVLSDLYAQHCGGQWLLKSVDGIEQYRFSAWDHSSLGIAIQPVMEWAGLIENNPRTSKGYLTALNDSGLYTFGELANVIEASL